MARRGGSRSRHLRDRDEGQVHRRHRRRAPRQRARHGVLGRRKPRRPPVRSRRGPRRPPRRRRDVELPGDRCRPHAVGRRGHVARRGPPRLARLGGALPRRQALPDHPARGALHGDRRVSRAARAARAARRRGRRRTTRGRCARRGAGARRAARGLERGRRGRRAVRCGRGRGRRSCAGPGCGGRLRPAPGTVQGDRVPRRGALRRRLARDEPAPDDRRPRGARR